MGQRGRPKKNLIPKEKWTMTYVVMGSKDKKGKYNNYKVVRNQDDKFRCNCLAFQCGRTSQCKHITNIKQHLFI